MRDEYYIYSRFFLYKRRMEYNLTIFFKINGYVWLNKEYYYISIF